MLLAFGGLLCAALIARLPAAPPGPRAVSFGAVTRLGGDQPFSFVAGQTEPAIAVNPADPRNLVAVFHDNLTSPRKFLCRFAHSADGGATWTLGGAAPLEADGHTCSDPSIAADLQGRFYYAYLAIGDAPLDFEASIAVAVSEDGGRTFPVLSIAEPRGGDSNDKPYLAVDAWPRSPFRGNVYVSYTDFLTGIRAVASRDGARTWGAASLVALFPPDPRYISSGSVPAVAPDGTVYVFFAEYNFRMGGLFIRFVRSSDGGATWRAPETVAANLPSPGEFRLKNADPDFGTETPAGFRSNSFPTVAITPDGTLFVAWTDFPAGSCPQVPGLNASPCTNGDVRMVVSRNAGRSWTAPAKVSDDGGATDQFFPWIAAHPDGLVSLVWMDRRLDPADNLDYDAFYSNTRDGSAFLPNVRASMESALVGFETFVGDYSGIAATAGGVFPIWTGVRMGSGARSEEPVILTAAGGF
jgi:hypothetical protein